MILGKVVHRVVSTARLDTIPARALLSIAPLEGFGDPAVPFVALDSVGAGPGETVLVLQEGTGARQALFGDAAAAGQILPAQLVVVGIVDQIQTG